MEKRTFDRKAVCVLRFSTTYKVRVQHAGLFAGSADLRSFLAQESSQVAAFVSASIGRAASAQRAALAWQHRCHDLSLHDPALQLHLFDALVRPVMLYGVETWGPGALCGSGMDSCELVQRKFLRSILGVRTGTPNVAVLEGRKITCMP